MSTLDNKLNEDGYDADFDATDKANAYENYNLGGGNDNSILRSTYRYIQDYERRKSRNTLYRGFQAVINSSDVDIGISGTDPAEAIVAGRAVLMDTLKKILNSSLTDTETNWICIKLTSATENSTRDMTSETFAWVVLDETGGGLSTIDDTYLVICSVDKNGSTLSNLVQLTDQYEVETNRFRPKYGDTLSFYVGDGDTGARSLSMYMSATITTSYLPIHVDVIDEETTDAGVTIETILLKDGNIDVPNAKYVTVDTINESTGAAGVTIETVLLKDGNVDIPNGKYITTDIINESTGAVGVTIEDMLIKGTNTSIKIDTNILYVNTIDDFSGGILTITPTTTISGALTASAGLDVTGNIAVSGTVDTVDVLALKTDVDGFDDTLKDLTTAEITQLKNIDTTTITSAIWGYVGNLNQDLATSDAVSFTGITSTTTLDVTGNTVLGGTLNAKGNISNSIGVVTISDDANVTGNLDVGSGLDVTGNIAVSGTVDTVDVLALKTDVDGFDDTLKDLTTAEITQLKNIDTKTISNTQWGYLGSQNQLLATTSNATFNTLTTATPYTYTYVTKTHSIPATQFIPCDGYTAVYGSVSGGSSLGAANAGLTNDAGYMICPVNLPDDCYIATITFWAADTSGAATLYKTTHSAAGAPIGVVVQVLTRNTATNVGHQVDNDGYHYYIQYNPGDVYANGGRINSVEVKYRVSKADMSYA